MRTPWSNLSLLQNTVQQQEKIILLCSTEQESSRIYREFLIYQQIPELKSQHTKILLLPSWDILPYDILSPSKEIMSIRAASLVEMYKADSYICITSVGSFSQKIPQLGELLQHTQHINVGNKYDLKDFIQSLSDAGYYRSYIAQEIGEFAVRGDIVDIVTHQSACRINFGWNQIDNIKIFSPETQITSKQIEFLTIYPPSELIFNSDHITRFKKNFLTKFGVHRTSDTIYQNICKNLKCQAIENLLPLFYDQLTSLEDYGAKIISSDDRVMDIWKERIDIINDFFESRKNTKYFAIDPTHIWNLTPKEYNRYYNDQDGAFLPQFVNFIQNNQSQQSYLQQLESYIQNNQISQTIIVFYTENTYKKFETLLKEYKIEINYQAVIAEIYHGFITPSLLLITEHEIFGEKIYHKTDSRKKLKNILTELEHLIPGDLVAHKEHGIGRFIGVENLVIANQSRDFLKLIYANEDKLFVPVENIDVVKKYGEQFEIQLDKLGSLGWQKRKSQMKNRVGELALKLMQISAKRELAKMEPLLINYEEYNKFTKLFPYAETLDQHNAVSDIIADLESSIPMDRLICGDVGFGKTEVAMRAAFLVASIKSQVAIICPTTILARQHYINFKERFRGFNINIKMISGLVANHEISENRHLLEQGKIDIIIGTHSILNLKFANLALMIIDEEQHFGVKQKEKLREHNMIHVLSMSATPIPRSLQMSLMSIKQLSLITTPPIDRLPTKTTIITDDDLLIRNALMKEYLRGGRSFYVAPRISLIEDIAKKLTNIVPELKFKIAHGQMKPKEIDQIMHDFYDGGFDILIATTIIESGIDVKIANTMIIHQAEILGLSQLYQLRGRVGRSKLRGYLYLIVKDHNNINPRLELISSIESLGGSFAIATHDMEQRGFGNLVGEEQSGNIKEVGLELYQDMLQEAIDAIKNNSQTEDSWSPTINIGVPVYIPESYIADTTLRLAIYRRTGALQNLEEIDNFISEMYDRFGDLPQEMRNLLEIIKIKNICKKLYIEKFDLTTEHIIVKFLSRKDLHDKIMNFVAKYPRISKIKPDAKLCISLINIQPTDPVSKSLAVLTMLNSILD